MTHSACFVIVAALVSACAPGQAPGDDEAGDLGGSESGEPQECAAITDASACGASELACEWVTLALAQRSGDACEVSEVGYCQQEVINTTISSCEVLTGCWTDTPFLNPAYKPTPAGVLLMETCNGTSEPGFMPCPSAVALEDDPPECACACELAP